MKAYTRNYYNFLRSVQDLVEREQLILPGDKIVCALSGGLDSVMLFNFLLYYREKEEFELSACHLNHGIRALAADQDEAFVRELCHKSDVELFVRHVDIPAMARDERLSIETAGRMARQELFQDIIEELSGTDNCRCRVALAHHADDAVETFLLNLGRGSSARGVSAMRISDEIIIRPLLETRVSDLRELALSEEIVWQEDETNKSDEYLRNRVRHQLIPLWSDLLHYDVSPVLLRYIRSVREDEDFLAELAERELNNLQLADGSLSSRALSDLDPALQKRLLRSYLEDYYLAELDEVEPDLTNAHLTAICSSLEETVRADSKKRLHSLPLGVVVEITSTRLLLLNNEQLC